jgi:hypothetical protein
MGNKTITVILVTNQNPPTEWRKYLKYQNVNFN